MNTERVYDETATIVPVSPFVAMTFVEWVRIALTGMVTGVLSMGAMLLQYCVGHSPLLTAHRRQIMP